MSTIHGFHWCWLSSFVSNVLVNHELPREIRSFSPFCQCAASRMILRNRASERAPLRRMLIPTLYRRVTQETNAQMLDNCRSVTRKGSLVLDAKLAQAIDKRLISLSTKSEVSLGMISLMTSARCASLSKPMYLKMSSLDNTCGCCC